MKHNYTGRQTSCPTLKPTSEEVLKQLVNSRYQTYEILDRYRQATNGESVTHEEIERLRDEYPGMPDIYRQSFDSGGEDEPEQFAQ